MDSTGMRIGRASEALAERQCGCFGVDVTAPPDGLLIVLELVGELDIDTVDLLKEAIAGRPPDTALVLDLRRLEFIDSTGLRVIVETLADARRSRWRLGLLPGPPALRRVFEISGLGPHLPFVEHPEDVL